MLVNIIYITFTILEKNLVALKMKLIILLELPTTSTVAFQQQLRNDL